MTEEEQKAKEEEIKKRDFLKIFETIEDMDAWIDVYLGLKLPYNNVSGQTADSSDDVIHSSPGLAIWEGYKTYRDDLYIENPGYIWIANRDGAKTISGSILNILLITHFKAEIAHLAAVKKQAEKCIEYTNIFLRKIKPYLTHYGRKIVSDSKSKIQIENEDGSVSYIDVVVANLAGGNCVDPNTTVYTDKGIKKAIEIKKGDKLLTFDYFQNKDVYVESDGIALTRKEALNIEFDDSSNIIVSTDHLVFTQSGWVAAGKLKLNHKMTNKRDTFIRTTKTKELLSEYTILRDSEQILYGTLLGGASISCNGTVGKYRYQVSHTEAQLSYLDVIKKTLNEQGFETNEKYYEWPITKVHPNKMYGIATKINEKINNLYKEFYPQGKKIITGKILDKLNWEGIAYWFMDDVCGNGKVIGLKKNSAYRLYTSGFSKEENDLISEWFKSKGFDNRVNTYTNSSKKRYFQIRFTLDASRKLTNFISPYFVEDLRYKLVPTFEEIRSITIDLGKLTSLKKDNFGFSWSNKQYKKHFNSQAEYRNWVQNTKEQLKTGIKSIKRLDFMPMIDIFIKTDKPHLQSFYINSHKLVHNSQRAHVGSYDELDTLSKQGLQGYKEAQLIPTRKNGHGPMRIKYSTRKFRFGVFAKEIEKAQQEKGKDGEKVLQWNLLDITEYCPPTRNKKNDGQVHERFVKKELPMLLYTEEQVAAMKDAEAALMRPVKVHTGCLTCPLAAVCQGKLSERPESNISENNSLFKTIDFSIGQFRVLKGDPDMAEAQLLCFGENTQILLKDGTTKSIKEISIGDEVITHKGNFCKVTEKLSRNYKGEILKINLPTWKGFEPTIVTPEHPFFINGNDFVEIKKVKNYSFSKKGKLIEKGDYFSLPAKYEINEKENINLLDFLDADELFIDKDRARFKHSGSLGLTIPIKYKTNKEFGWFLGYYLAEGHLTNRSKSKNLKEERIVSITLSSHKKEKIIHNKVKCFIEKIGLETVDKDIKNKNTHIQIINNSVFSSFVYKLCGRICDKKFIKTSLFNLNLEFLEGILEGFFDGGGSKRFEASKELTTTSYKLATQLFTIASRLNLNPRITKSKFKSKKQIYRVYVENRNFTHKQKRTKYLNTQDYNLYRSDAKNVSLLNYNGLVYNIEVEKDNSYIADGIAVHNCWRPSSAGLVYPRYSDSIDNGNVMSVATAYQKLMGEDKSDVTHRELIEAMHQLGIRFYAGLDWGHTKEFTMVVAAKMPDDTWWLVDNYASPGLELSEQIEAGKKFQEKYRIHKWFPDQAYPGAIKTWSKEVGPCEKFTKDVMGGIEATRGVIMNGVGKRKLYIIDGGKSNRLRDTFKMHAFILDNTGEPTENPDDGEYSDTADSIRYLFQNVASTKGRKPIVTSIGNVPEPTNSSKSNSATQVDRQTGMILENINNDAPTKPRSGGKKGFSWSI